MSKIYAGMVLYDPKNELYLKSIQTLIDNEIILIILDNSPKKASRTLHNQIISSKHDIKFISFKEGNIGLAAAYNCIIDNVLKDNDAEGLFIFDQDTEITTKAIKKLLLTYKSLLNTNVGSISGYALRTSGIPYRIRLDKSYNNKDATLKRVSRVPSSFTFYPVSTIRKIGFFQVDFFIDHLDIDYSMRCIQNNLAVYIDTESKYVHCVGNEDVYLFKRPLFPISDPYRHYYQIRNLIISHIRNKKSIFLIIKEIISKVLVVFIIGVYAGSFFERFRYLFLGIAHGFQNKGGELKQK